MSDPVPHGPGPSTAASHRGANLALVAVAVLLLVATVLLLTRDASATPEESRAATLSSRYAAVTEAAEAETLAFLTVDHRDMEPLVEKVLAGATGAFEKQYRGSREQLVASTRRSEAVSTGEVLHVGVSELTADRAVVLVAANSQVTNKATKGEPQPRSYRLRLILERQGERWLTSGLEFVG